MKPFKPKNRNNPERKIQNKIIEKLSALGWYVRVLPSTSGNVGWPDLFACHFDYGFRWIEVKAKTKYRFTDAQMKWFPIYRKYNWKVWILQDEKETDLLFKKPSWAIFDKYCLKTKASPIDYYEAAIDGTTPEASLQRNVVRKLTDEGWLCRHIVGNLVRSGWPDLYVHHPTFGGKWVELKIGNFKFTPAQRNYFPKFFAQRCGIWFVTSDKELEILEKPPNWDFMFSRIL